MFNSLCFYIKNASTLDIIGVTMLNYINALWQVHGPHGLWWKPPETGAFPFLDVNLPPSISVPSRIYPDFFPKHVSNLSAKFALLGFLNALIDQTAGFR